MSSFNNRGLALAIAAALFLPATAMAATVDYTNAPVAKTYASNLFVNPATSVLTPDTITYEVQNSDNIIGRTTGFGVRLTLVGGPTFGATQPTVTLGAAATDFVPGTSNVAGNIAVYSFPSDATASPNIDVGDLFEISTFSVAGAAGVLANGGTVTLKIELFDSNSNQVLADLTKNLVIIDAVEGTTVTVLQDSNYPQAAIDVAACAAGTSSPAAAKTQFSWDAVVGSSCNWPGLPYSGYFNAGSVNIGITQVGNPLADVLANGFAGANNSGNPGPGTFQYDVANDEFTVTVSGSNFAAFNNASGNDRIELNNSVYCDGTVLAGGTINAAQNSVSFTLAPLSATTTKAYVCFKADPARLVEIAAQTLTASVAINFDDANVRDPSSRSGALLPLRYNGTVIQFQNVNPGGNPRAQSFLRFTNNSATNCPVSVKGRDDDGVFGDSTVNFSLAPGYSATFNSDELEGGSSKGTGAFGDGAGRWYVTATAECGSFVGSALNRNAEDGTVTNLTPQNHGQGL